MTRHRRLARLGSGIERFADVFNGGRRRFETWRRGAPPLQIVSFGGFGTPDAVTVSGRALWSWPAAPIRPKQGRLRNLAGNLRLLDSNEAAGVPLRVTVDRQTAEVTTDVEGYFHAHLTFDSAREARDARDAWREVTIESPVGNAVRRDEVLVPPAAARFGVISDLDDTVTITQVRRPWRAVSNVLLRNARSRAVFPGTAALYRALVAGPSGIERPLFYLSNSPWNLHDVLADVLQTRGFPRGPLLLRDYGFDAEVFLKDDRHKPEQLRRILTTYPTLPFLLIGDSGEHDPAIYRQTVRDFPGRVLAIVIRDVTRGLDAIEVERVTEGAAGDVVEMAHVPHAAAAGAFLAARGWIADGAEATVTAAWRDESVGRSKRGTA